MGFKEVHRSIMGKILEDKISEGIQLYFENEALYSSLPLPWAEVYWQQIIENINEVGKFQPISILMKDDPYLNRDPFSLTKTEIEDARYYRQNHSLTRDLFNYMLGIYKSAYELRQLKWVRVMDMVTYAEIQIPEGQRIPEGHVISENYQLN